MAFHPKLSSRRNRVLVACLAIAGGLSVGGVQAAPFSGFAPQPEAGIVLARDGYGYGHGYGDGYHHDRHRGHDRGWGERRHGWDHHGRRDHERHGWGHRRHDWGHHHHHGGGYRGDYRY